MIAQTSFTDSLINTELFKSLKILAENLAKTLEVERASIWKISDEDMKLERQILYDRETNTDANYRMYKTTDLSAYLNAIHQDSIIDAEDALNDPRTRELIDTYLKPLNIHSLLDSAIQQDGHLIGILSVEHRGSERFWHADEKSFINAMSNHVAQLFANEERKKVEAKLLESEYRFRKIFEDSATGMVMAGRDFKFLQANRAFCEMTGYNGDELKNLSFVDITHPDDRKIDLVQAKRMINGQVDHYQTEKRYQKKNGDVLWVTLTVSPIHNSSGDFMYFVGANTGEITALSQNNSPFFFLFKNSPLHSFPDFKVFQSSL